MTTTAKTTYLLEFYTNDHGQMSEEFRHCTEGESLQDFAEAIAEESGLERYDYINIVDANDEIVAIVEPNGSVEIVGE